jgi:hypothetical protein
VLRAYIEATCAIGAKMRVLCTSGFGFWFNTSEIDRLYRDTPGDSGGGAITYGLNLCGPCNSGGTATADKAAMA